MPATKDFPNTNSEINLSGPGERESVVFNAPNGGGGEFEIRVFNARTGKRVQEVLETTQEASESSSFSGQSFPVYVKVEGPGASAVGININ